MALCDSDRIELLELIQDYLNGKDLSRFFENDVNVYKVPGISISTQALEIP